MQIYSYNTSNAGWSKERSVSMQKSLNMTGNQCEACTPDPGHLPFADWPAPAVCLASPMTAAGKEIRLAPISSHEPGFHSNGRYDLFSASMDFLRRRIGPIDVHG
jgi:hypothetical protein